MPKIFKKLIPILPQIIASLFLTGFMVFAWTEPSQSPPRDNVPMPLNVGPTEQTKEGGLILKSPLKLISGTSWPLIFSQDVFSNFTITNGGQMRLTLDSLGNTTIAGDVKSETDFKTATNEGSCPIWKDCDGDGRTAGSGDCDEGCADCYTGSTGGGSTPDGKDNNCNGVIDEPEYLDYLATAFVYFDDGEVFYDCQWMRGATGWRISSGLSESYCDQGNIPGVRDCRAVYDRSGVLFGPMNWRGCGGASYGSWYPCCNGTAPQGYCSCSPATYR